MSWQSKLKKSNFDVGPSPDALLQYLPPPTFIFNGIDANIPIPIIANDPVFQQRLELSMWKSFQYIDRKDDIAAGLIAPDVSTNSLHQKQKKFANLFRQKVTTGLGAAAAVHHKHPPVDAGSKVYVSGLPLDFVDMDLEVLFSVLGKIKRIKLYTDPITGNKKGDGLITFVSTHAATAACIQFHGKDIGEGYILSVARAEFQPKAPADPSIGTSTVTGKQMDGHCKSRPGRSSDTGAMMEVGEEAMLHPRGLLTLPMKSQDAGLYTSLLSPSVCQSGRYPVLVLHNVYDLGCIMAGSEVQLVQAEIMEECGKHGRVLGICCITPENIQLQVMRDTSSTAVEVYDHVFYPNTAAVAVTFACLEDATSCLGCFTGIWYNNRQLWVELLDPMSIRAQIKEYQQGIESIVPVSDPLKDAAAVGSILLSPTAASFTPPPSILESSSSESSSSGVSALSSEEDAGLDAFFHGLL